MSRIHEALARAASQPAPIDRTDDAVRDVWGDTPLQDYPREDPDAAPAVEARDRLIRPLVPMPVERRLLARVQPVAEPPDVAVAPVIPDPAPALFSHDVPETPRAVQAPEPAAAVAFADGPEPAPLLPEPAHRAMVVRVTDQRTLERLDSEYEHKLVTGRKAPPIAVEQFRRLAATLHEAQVAHGLKSLLVTSTVPGEGKTLVSANLALTLSEACQRRVLLIDGDLRRPSVHKVFRLSNAFGLADVLRGGHSDLPLVRVSEYLTVLPSEPIEQPMAMTSERMRMLLDQCSTMFDWVLIDAAPVGFMPDAQLLARLTRAVLFVIAANATPHALVTRAIAELGAECIVGTVLNSVADEDIPGAAYYHDYYTQPDRSSGE